MPERAKCPLDSRKCTQIEVENDGAAVKAKQNARHLRGSGAQAGGTAVPPRKRGVMTGVRDPWDFRPFCQSRSGVAFSARGYLLGSVGVPRPRQKPDTAAGSMTNAIFEW